MAAIIRRRSPLLALAALLCVAAPAALAVKDEGLDDKSYQTAVRMIEKGELEVARDYLDAAIRRCPESIAALSRAAWLADRLDRKDEATVYAKRCLYVAWKQRPLVEAYRKLGGEDRQRLLDERQARLAAAQEVLRKREPALELAWRKLCELDAEAQSLDVAQRRALAKVVAPAFKALFEEFAPQGQPADEGPAADVLTGALEAKPSGSSLWADAAADQAAKKEDRKEPAAAEGKKQAEAAPSAPVPDGVGEVQMRRPVGPGEAEKIFESPFKAADTASASPPPAAPAGPSAPRPFKPDEVRRPPQDDASRILSELPTIGQLGKIAPGRIEALSDAYRPILVWDRPEDGKALIGVARPGKGKVVLTTAQELLVHPRLLPRYLSWAGLKRGTRVWVRDEAAALKPILAHYTGIIQIMEHGGGWDKAELGAGDVLILPVGLKTRALSDEEIVAVQRFVDSGGALITCGQAWAWKHYGGVPAARLPDFWLNRLIAPFGARFADGFTAMPSRSSADLYDETGRKVGTVEVGR